MPRLHLLPIEPFPERYTAQWYRWWPAHLREQGVEVFVYDGDRAAATDRTGGEWLDPTNTWVWKGTQLAAFARAVRVGDVRDKDVVLTLDGWGPASTMLPYLRATTGLNFRIAAYWHAGAHDPHDYLARVGMAPWALSIEAGWVRAADVILCGSAWHRARLSDLLSPWGGASAPHIVACGAPLFVRDLLHEAGRAKRVPWDERDPVVIFPHRLAPEKQPRLFRELERRFRQRYPDVGVRFVMTQVESRSISDERQRKAAYYDILARARVAVSFAKQETFGIAMQEAALLGCRLVVPDRLSYPSVCHPGHTTFFPGDGDDAAHLDDVVDAVYGAVVTPHSMASHDEAADRHAAAITRASAALFEGLT